MTGGELDLFKIILESGIVVKSVLGLLILASIASWAIVLSKKSTLNTIEENDLAFMRIYESSKNMKEVYDRIGNVGLSPKKSIFEHGYKELIKVNEKASQGGSRDQLVREHFKDFGFGLIQRAMKAGTVETNEKIERSLSTLASIGSVSPFIGLFGTVWGIIDSFTGLAGGGATIDAVAPGIAEALVATAVGLAAAIPAVWFFNIFNNKGAQIGAEMEAFEQDFLNNIEQSIVS